MVIYLFLDGLIFTLLRVWGYEFGIPNPYTDFKIALDTTLVSSQMLEKTNYPVPRKYPGKWKDRRKINKTEGRMDRPYFKGLFQLPTFLCNKIS